MSREWKHLAPKALTYVAVLVLGGVMLVGVGILVVVGVLTGTWPVMKPRAIR